CRLPPHRNARAWSAERRNHEPPPCGGRALCVSRASPSGAPRVAFLSPGPRFLVSVPAPVAVLEAPAQRLTRLANRAGTIGAVPVQRSSSRSGRSAARAGPRGLPSAGVRTPPAGAALCSISETSREDALNEQSAWNIILVQKRVKPAYSSPLPLRERVPSERSGARRVRGYGLS